MRQKFLSLFLLIALLVMPACTPQATATEAPIDPTEAIVVPANTEVPPTPVPPTAIPEPRTLTVFAAASLTESFGELGTMFESCESGCNHILQLCRITTTCGTARPGRRSGCLRQRQ